MRERREKGLCYNCDKKWNPAHKCKISKLYMLQGVEILLEANSEEVFYDTTDKVEPVEQIIEPVISFNAISGSLSSTIMRIVGLIKNQWVVVLIDSGNTHNFLDPTVFKLASLGEILPMTLHVRVANGANILSERKCNSVSLKVQGMTITADFYLLPFGGCDIVLGVEWLKTLGPILWDFSLLTMQYSQGSNKIILHGLTPTGLTIEDGDHFLRSFSSNA
jgi:hypothetical protein